MLGGGDAGRRRIKRVKRGVYRSLNAFTSWIWGVNLPAWVRCGVEFKGTRMVRQLAP